MTSAAHRRRSLAAMAGANIRAAAVEIQKNFGVDEEQAMLAVFADQELLDECHRVTGRTIPAQPKSDIDAQNG